MILPDDITAWLQAREGADHEALARLYPLLYDQLRRLAHRQLAGERDGHTLGTTALVHESFLRLAEGGTLHLNDRNHFFALAARTMRYILIDYARARTRAKRGGGATEVTFEEARVMPEARAEQLLALDAALDRLARRNDRLARIVEHRYFAGFTIEETADALGVSTMTVKRDWNKAKAFLARELAAAGEH